QGWQVADDERLVRNLRLGKYRGMIQGVRPLESCVAVRLHGAVHVDVPVIHERFLKPRKRAAHVAKVDHDDFIDSRHLADGIVDVHALHLRHASLAKQHAVRPGWNDVEYSAELIEVRGYVRASRQGWYSMRNGRIVGMQGHAHA